MSRPFDRLLISVLVLLLASTLGCVTEYPDGIQSPHMKRLKIYSDREAHDFKPIMTRYNLDPPLSNDWSGSGDQEKPELFNPFHKFSPMRYLGDDGTISMHYYLEAGSGHRIAALLIDLMPGLFKIKDSKATLAPNEITVFPNFIKDHRRTADVTNSDFSKFGKEARNACDLLVVNADQGMLTEVEETIARLLTEIPLVEIKVRVIEVALQDRLEYGIDGRIYKDTTGQPFLNTIFQTDEAGELLIDENTGDFIYESGGWTTKFNTESMSVGGAENFQGSLFHVAGVHDKMVLDALIELVQKTSESQILSAPEITVLNGHKAVIETGTKIPVQEVVNNPNNTVTYAYKYEDTGVKLVILPNVLMDGTIQIEVNSEVVTIAGQESVETLVGTVNIPIFTTRNLSNIATVKEGEAFFLGGLLARSEIQQVNKVPLLGDIPILGYLFKSKSTELRETQIIFYIEPHIVRAEEALYMPAP